MSTDPVRFKYGISKLRSFGIVAVGIAIAAGFAYMAYDSTKGVRLFHLVTLTPDQARILWAIFALLGVFVTVVACVLAARSLQGPAEIVVGDKFLIAPRAALKYELLQIPYSGITGVQLQQIKQEKMLIIDSTVGQSRLMASGFGSDFEFAQFQDLLHSRLKG